MGGLVRGVGLQVRGSLWGLCRGGLQVREVCRGAAGGGVCGGGGGAAGGGPCRHSAVGGALPSPSSEVGGAVVSLRLEKGLGEKYKMLT